MQLPGGYLNELTRWAEERMHTHIVTCAERHALSVSDFLRLHREMRERAATDADPEVWPAGARPDAGVWTEGAEATAGAPNKAAEARSRAAGFNRSIGNGKFGET